MFSINYSKNTHTKRVSMFATEFRRNMFIQYLAKNQIRFMLLSYLCGKHEAIGSSCSA